MEIKTSDQPIIADSSALVSLAIVTDTNHQAARDSFQVASRTGRSILIPNEVFAETVNLLGKKFGHGRALEVAELFLSAALFLVIPTSDIIRRDALKLFSTVPADVSYTDCMVMVTADHHGTRTVFGFDDIFRRKGYHLPKTVKHTT